MFPTSVWSKAGIPPGAVVLCRLAQESSQGKRWVRKSKRGRKIQCTNSSVSVFVSGISYWPPQISWLRQNRARRTTQACRYHEQNKANTASLPHFSFSINPITDSYALNGMSLFPRYLQVCQHKKLVFFINNKHNHDCVLINTQNKLLLRARSSGNKQENEIWRLFDYAFPTKPFSRSGKTSLYQILK